VAAGSKDERTEVTERVRSLLESQPLAVLSSSAQGHPYTNLVAFAATEDLRRVVFATMRATRKYQNMHEDPRVSLLIDDRSNRVSDIRDALAVTAQGRTVEAVGADREALERLFLRKHPHLEGFVRSPGCALMAVTVSTYYVVSRFQNVYELHLGPEA